MRGRPKDDDSTRLLAEAQLKLVDLQRQLDSARDRDHVTGLQTLQRFRAQLDIEIDRSRRHGRVFSVALVDVDGFKALNAHHGLSAGDSVLRAVAESLDNNTRAHDVICRSSNDEFSILMPETPLQGAVTASKRIVADLEGVRIGAIETIGVSIGIAEFTREQHAPEILDEALAALLQARHDGGARVAHGAESPPDAVVETRERDAIEALAQALTERDRYTGEHSESVVTMVAAVGRNLGLPSDEVDRIKYAALLHDIGKVAIPDEILNKPAALTDDEYAVMKDHTVIGERILRAIPGMGSMARIVRHEHERWDGNGYPDGLAGAEIPVGSRIILACDAYHAMTSDRPYRKAMSHADALAELTRNAGTQFDPQVCEILVGHLYGQRQGAGIGVGVGP